MTEKQRRAYTGVEAKVACVAASQHSVTREIKPKRSVTVIRGWVSDEEC